MPTFSAISSCVHPAMYKFQRAPSSFGQGLAIPSSFGHGRTPALAAPQSAAFRASLYLFAGKRGGISAKWNFSRNFRGEGGKFLVFSFQFSVFSHPRVPTSPRLPSPRRQPGNRPARAKVARISTLARRFSLSSLSVARPTAVKGQILPPSIWK